jgi:hypothetical protein
MIHIKDPAQINLFDLETSFLANIAQKRLETSFYSVFRHVILSLLPAQEIANHFNPDNGRPTKELYSMAGLILLKEFKNWTTTEATEAYLFDYRTQYALNTGRDNISFCERTLERYMTIMRSDKLAIKIFDTVTTKLIEELDIEISSQRLDSTHVFSDMATFARTKLMGVGIKRFLTQLKRHHLTDYEKLDSEILDRYKKGENSLFADHSKDKTKRSNLREEVAQQLYHIIILFNGHEKIENMDTYKQLVTIFNQQCEIISPVDLTAETAESAEKSEPLPPIDQAETQETNETEPTESPIEKEATIAVKKKTGGDVIQNPSDPDATYDGHKGVGYQVQICETADSENEVQLITSIHAQTAVESDAKALDIILEKLEDQDLLPDELYADTLYGSDENHTRSSKKGIDLISPVSGSAPATVPEKPTQKQQRLGKRRAAQESKEWKTSYKIRAQVEGTIGSIKRLTGMVRLRYRGKESIFSSIELKLSGWNISRAQASAKMQQKLAEIIKERRALALARAVLVFLLPHSPMSTRKAA